MKTAVVIGAGVSGIAAASALVSRGYATQVLESEPFLGGRIGTRPHQGAEIDLGGRNFTANDAHLFELLRTFGISKTVDYRFNSISVGVRRPFDMRSDGDRWTRSTRFLKNATTASPLELLRIQRVVAGARRDPSASVVGSAYWTRLAEENADPSAGSYFGRTISDQVLRPWTLRMMASEPEEVYLGNLGPLLGRQPGPLKRVHGGMGVFLRAAAERLTVKRGHRAEAVLCAGDKVTAVAGVTKDGARFREHADVVVVATPASNAAEVLEVAPKLSALLRQIVYRPVATVVAEYENVEFPGTAGGLFLPRNQVVSHIAKYDDEQRIRFSFAGVAARRAFVDSSIADLLGIGESAFRDVGGRLGGRVSFIGNIWYPGLCAQTWMHHNTLASLRQCERSVKGLILTGDYFRGNSLEACVLAAEENVARLLGVHAKREPDAGAASCALDGRQVS